jgi:hypothetical protein
MSLFPEQKREKKSSAKRAQLVKDSTRFLLGQLMIRANELGFRGTTSVDDVMHGGPRHVVQWRSVSEITVEFLDFVNQGFDPMEMMKWNLARTMYRSAASAIRQWQFRL